MPLRTRTEDILFTLIGVLILAACLRDGIGITFDSYLYLLGGSYLLQNGFSDILAVPAFQAKPPVLSGLYALLQNDLWLIRISNLLFLGGSLWANFKFVNLLVGTTFFRRFIKALLATATPFMLVHSFLWSEPFFIFILSLYYLLSYQALAKPAITKQLYLLPLLGLLLVGLRHIGVVFAIVCSLYLLLHYKRFTKRQLIPVLLNVILPPLALLGWHVGVLVHGSDTEAYNLLKDLDLMRNFLVYADVLKVWLVPPGLPFPNVLAVLAFIIYGAVAVIAVKQSYSSELKHLVILFIVSATAYAGLMLFKGDLLVDDNERYLSVVYAPLTMLLFYVVSNWAVQTTINRNLIYLLLLLWFSYPLVRTLYNANRWAHNGINAYNPALAPPEILEYSNP
ncbi:hypothetical protein [Pontibacter populi]|uniref:Glycosyltransferase RgtA/B/C/D-like domain-containing protein n=1 Tax=Pontibacter populi TaxID=890055 RepID=A0ABV1RUH3_9BACT